MLKEYTNINSRIGLINDYFITYTYISMRKPNIPKTKLYLQHSHICECDHIWFQLSLDKLNNVISLYNLKF